jgi:hypothetical protein
MNMVDVPASLSLLMGQSFDHHRRAFTLLGGDYQTGESHLLTVGLDGGGTTVSGAIKGPIKGQRFQLESIAVIESPGDKVIAVGVGCDTSQALPPCGMVTVDVATGNHTRKAVVLATPTAATVIPIYAFNKATMQLHQLFQLPTGDACVITINVETGLHGKCISLSTLYTYLSMLETPI